MNPAVVLLLGVLCPSKFLALPSSLITATMLAAMDELAGISTVEQAKAWAGVSDIAWNGLQDQLGQVTNL